MDTISPFGKPIGSHIIPKIRFGMKKILGALTIDEIHLHFKQVWIHSGHKAELQAISAQSFKRDENTLVILPSQEQVCV